MLDDVLGSSVRGRGGDVVQRGLFREQLRLWPGQETLIDRLKGHRDGSDETQRELVYDKKKKKRERVTKGG